MSSGITTGLAIDFTWLALHIPRMCRRSLGILCPIAVAVSLLLTSCIESTELDNPLFDDNDGDGLLGVYDCDDSDASVGKCAMGDFCALSDQCSGQGECIKGVCECTSENYSGALCNSCASNFSGSSCNSCANGWTGAACDVCPPNYQGASCDTCASYVSGAECNQPLDYSGYIAVPAGLFTMGCTAEQQGLCYNQEYPAHDVSITRAFWLKETEVTQAEYSSLMGGAPSFFSPVNGYPECSDCPVESVNFYDAVAYANALSTSEGLAPCYKLGENTVEVITDSGSPYDCEGYRLPTEAEWEYAARAGQDYRFAGGNDLTQVCWYESNSNGRTHPVGSKAPNAWGFYDMSGNVSEWCWDWFLVEFYGVSPFENPVGPTSPPVESPDYPSRVARGGDYPSSSVWLRTSARDFKAPVFTGRWYGIRLARSAPQ